MPRKVDGARVAEAARRYAAGQTSREIAAAMGIAPSTVENWVRPQIRPRGPRPRPVPDQRILDMKDREGLAFERIAVLVGMSKTGVRKRYAKLKAEQAAAEQAE